MSDVKSPGYSPARTWISYGLPFRPVSGTYESCSAASLPPLSETDVKPFQHLRTLEDVAPHAKDIDKVVRSPTGCSVNVDLSSGLVYGDSQGCVYWYFTKLNGVHILSGADGAVAIQVCCYVG